ncbi:hypothetical protein CMI37_19565 [Candidatus Pacearchaeota archaeon]|nr:hypothetical protein [Candidatus Pacearchaeota archaeon]
MRVCVVNIQAGEEVCLWSGETKTTPLAGDFISYPGGHKPVVVGLKVYKTDFTSEPGCVDLFVEVGALWGAPVLAL